MRKPLDKRLARDLKTNLGKYIAIFLLLAATITFGSGFLVVADSSFDIFKKNQIECKVEDGNFESYQVLTDENIKAVEKLDLKITRNYYINYQYSEGCTLRIIQNRTEINLPSLFEGNLPTQDNEIVIDRLWAKNKKINVGDNIDINNNVMKVTGLIAVPDYNSLFKSNSDMVMDATNFGISIITEQGLDKIAQNNSIKYSYSYYYNNRQLTEKQKMQKEEQITQELLKQTQLLNFTPARANQCISFLETDLGSDIPAMKALVYVMIAVMAFVFAVLINSTIEQEASIIGTLRASGYRKIEIVLHYIKMPVIITVASAIIGNLIAYTLLIEPYKALYYDFFSLPPLKIEWNTEAFLLTTLVPVAIMILINYIMLTKKLSLSPLKFLRRDLKKSKNQKAVKLPNKLDFKNRFRLRVILQNKGSYLILFIGIFFASFLLMFGIGMEPLIQHYEETVADSVVADYQYILKVPVENNKGEKMTVYSLETYFKLADRDVDVNFYGIEDNSKYYTQLKLVNKSEGIVISDSFAKKLDIKIGDEIKFNDKYLEKEYTLKVNSIYEDRSGYVVYMPKQQLNDMLGLEADYFNGYISNEKLNINDEYISKTISKQDLTGTVQQMMASFKELLVIINVFAVAMYLVLMYVLTKVVIDKNTQSISLMKVFGYTQKEVKKLYLRATTYVILLSLILTIPLEIVCFDIILKYAFLRIEGYLEFFVPQYIYIEIIAAGIISYLVINSIHVRKLKKIEAREALKNRE